MQRIAPMVSVLIMVSMGLTLMTMPADLHNARSSLSPDKSSDQTYKIERSKKLYPRYQVIIYTHHLMPSNTVITVRQRTHHSSKIADYSGHTKKCSDVVEVDLEDAQATFMQCQQLWRQVHIRKKNCSIL